MARRLAYVENATSHDVVGSVTAGATTCTVLSGDRQPAQFPYYLAIWDRATYANSAAAKRSGAYEIVKVTSRTMNTINAMVRGQDGTVAIPWSTSGGSVWEWDVVVPKAEWNEIDRLLDLAQSYANELRAEDPPYNVLPNGEVQTGGIQAAMDAVSAAGGGHVLLGAGTFVVDDTTATPDSRCLVPRPNVTLRGLGRGVTIIKLKDTAAGNSPRIFSVDAACQNFALEDLTLDGNKANNTGGSNDQKHGFMVFGFAADDLRLTRVELKNCDGDGIAIHATCQRVTIDDCSSHDNDRIGINVTGCSNSLIWNNRTRSNGAWGIKGEIDAGAVGQIGTAIVGNRLSNEVNGIGLVAANPLFYEDWEISSNVLETLSGNAIQAQGGIRGLILSRNRIRAATNHGILIGMDAHDVSITDNRISGMLFTSGARAGCIVLGGQSGTLVRDVSMVGNKMMGGAVRGIVIGSSAGVAEAALNVQAIGNTMDGVAIDAIEVGDANGVLLQGNAMVNMTVTNMFLRHYSLGGVQDCRILGNQFSGTATHITIEDFAAAVTDLVLDDNCFPATGVHLSNPNRIAGVYLRGANVNFDEALVAGDIVLSAGWGVGAAVSAITGTDRGARFTVTAGTAPGSAPTITVTYKNGSWGAKPPQVSVNIAGGTSPVLPILWSSTATQLNITYEMIPVAGLTYIFQFMAQSEPR